VLTIKIVVTGSTGFIGTALCKKLEEKKEYSIIKVTRSKKDKDGFYQVNNYQNCPSGDILIHLGEDPDRNKVNEAGNFYQQKSTKVIKSILIKDYKKIIYCSSSVVYGDQGVEPYGENMPTYADDVYSTAKLENEKRVLNSGGIVVRLSNVIGNNKSKNNILSDIIKQLSEEGSLTIRNINPIRDFIWIEDAVDAIVSLLQKNTSGVFNIGSGIATSIDQLTKTVLNIAGQRDREVKSIITSSEYAYSVLNVEKIKKITGWKPKHTLFQSIKKMVNRL
jgi:UDP-glucose 4-epimerase